MYERKVWSACRPRALPAGSTLPTCQATMHAATRSRPHNTSRGTKCRPKMCPAGTAAVAYRKRPRHVICVAAAAQSECRPPALSAVLLHAKPSGTQPGSIASCPGATPAASPAASAAATAPALPTPATASPAAAPSTAATMACTAVVYP